MESQRKVVNPKQMAYLTLYIELSQLTATHRLYRVDYTAREMMLQREKSKKIIPITPDAPDATNDATLAKTKTKPPPALSTAKLKALENKTKLPRNQTQLTSFIISKPDGDAAHVDKRRKLQ